MNYVHSFAKQWLSFLHYELYAGDKRILDYKIKKPNYKIATLPTKIFIGQDFTTTKSYRRIGINEFREMGFTIASVRLDMNKPTLTEVHYIAKRMKGVVEVSELIKSEYIEYDQYRKKARLISPKALYREGNKASMIGKSNWVSLEEDFVLPEENIDYDKLWTGQVPIGPKPVRVPEIAVMFTDDNYLLCIPKQRDMQGILIVGKKRYGKSFLWNRLLGQIWIKFQDRIGGIDPLDQFHSISEPGYFFKSLRLINEEPRAIPSINLYMSAPNLAMRYEKEGVEYRYVDDFLSYMNRWSFFTYGIKKYVLGGPESYLNSLKKNFVKCKDEEDIKKAMFEFFSDYGKKEVDKGLKSMVMKWVEKFGNLFAEEFTSNLFPDDSPYWTLKTPTETIKSNPFIIAMEARLVPILNTSKAKRQSTFRNRIADLIYSMINWQTQRGDKRHRMWLGIDEASDIHEIGKRKDDNCGMAYEEYCRQGGPLSLGYVNNTQSYAKLHPEVKKNTSHLFATLIDDSSERREIRERYNLSKEQSDELGQLNRFEFVAISSENWIAYNKFGERKPVPPGRIFKGTTIPPISKHIAPT